MNRMKTGVCLLLMMILVPSAIGLQAKTSTEQAANAQPDPRNRLLQKITLLLDQVLEAQKSFADENLRIMIQAHVADLLMEPR